MTIVYAPAAAVDANAAQDLPGGARLQSLTRVVRFRGSDGTAAAAGTVLTVTTDPPDAGKVRMVAGKQLEFGDALTAADLVIIEGVELGARPIA